MTLFQKLRAANLIDCNGLVCLVGQTGGTDNGCLFTAQALVLCGKAGEGIDQDHIDAMIAIGKCLNNGNPVRKPGDYDQNSPDNLIAMSAVSSSYAELIYNYGKPLGLYNTLSPGKFTVQAWLGRQLGLVGFMQLMIGRFTNPLRLLSLYIGFYLTSRQPLTQTSDRLLVQLMIDTMPEHWYTRPIINWWRNTIRKQYARGINDCVLLYFGPTHFFSQVDWS